MLRQRRSTKTLSRQQSFLSMLMRMLFSLRAPVNPGASRCTLYLSPTRDWGSRYSDCVADGDRSGVPHADDWCSACDTGLRSPSAVSSDECACAFSWPLRRHWLGKAITYLTIRISGAGSTNDTPCHRSPLDFAISHFKYSEGLSGQHLINVKIKQKTFGIVL